MACQTLDAMLAQFRIAFYTLFDEPEHLMQDIRTRCRLS
jgi:hypothetical protein